MKVSECMSRDLQTVRTDQPISEAAKFMLSADTGVLPVTDGDGISGIVTDRDIAVRGVAEGLGPDTPVSRVMTSDVLSVYDDQHVSEAADLMSKSQVRRLPVRSRDGEQLIGVISLADITRSEQATAATVALGGITDPGGRHNQKTD